MMPTFTLPAGVAAAVVDVVEAGAGALLEAACATTPVAIAAESEINDNVFLMLLNMRSSILLVKLFSFGF
jgi:hypothetical protein